MGKLGKNARKFARKNLQSVLKKRRKFKSMINHSRMRRSRRPYGGISEVTNTHLKEEIHGCSRNYDETCKEEALANISLEALFGGEDADAVDDASDSSGFLSEDATSPDFIGSRDESDAEEISTSDGLLEQNQEIQLELDKQKHKLERMKKKDPKFLKFLKWKTLKHGQSKDTRTSIDDEWEIGDQDEARASEVSENCRILTTSSIDTWSCLFMNQNNMNILSNILNGYRVACHYGIDRPESCSGYKIVSSRAYGKIIIFMLSEADGIFRKLLGISGSCCKKLAMIELENLQKWEYTKPLIKSYLRNTMFLLDQITEDQMLVFTLSRLKASAIFFAAFPSLLRRLIQVAVRFWVTGRGNLSLSAFSVLRELSIKLDPSCFDICLIKTYKAFVISSKYMDATDPRHVQFLGDSVVELYSFDIQKSYPKVLASIQQLARIVHITFRTRDKEARKMIDNWQFMNCIRLWVDFIFRNSQDYTFKSLQYLVIQIIVGVAHIFTGLRYLPLRRKCIEMLNKLSSSTGVFIPVGALILSFLEHRSTRARKVQELDISFLSILKVPKPFIKSYEYQEWCILSAVELLAAHFAQWCFHISFPELAAIPLIKMKKLYGKTDNEQYRHCLKIFIEQVEQNVEFVQKKRVEVTFSPQDKAAVSSFLQREKNEMSTSWCQYYLSIIKAR